MSANNMQGTRKKYEDFFKKDLTPKSSHHSPKISPVYSSFRAGLTMKHDLTPKSKIVRPSTSKSNSNYNENTFSSREDKKPTAFSSKPQINKEETMRRPLINSAQYEYQPRAKSKSPAKQPQQIVKRQLEVKYPQHIPMYRQIKSYHNPKPQLPKTLPSIPNFERAKHSAKANGIIKAYAASTHVGPVRQHNEDRVAIIFNINKTQANTKDWKKPAYFGVFDGHGGVDCADFLRDNLHVYVSREKAFPDNMQDALKMGFQKCQKAFVQYSKIGKYDRSGSCAIVCFFYGETLYVANVGDSRAIMSSRQGEIVSELSIDHKASCEYQQKRIMDAGGRIYQTHLSYADGVSKIFYEGEWHNFVVGPHRVIPGRLSTTRTFGDIQAKLPQLNGNPRGIIHEPELNVLKIAGDEDFVLLGSDGIFDKMSNSEIVHIIWDTLKRNEGKYKNIHQFCGQAVQNVMKLAFHKKTADNITVVLIALQGLQKHFAEKQSRRVSPNSSFNKTMMAESVRSKIPSAKYSSQFQRKYIGRSTSPTNYSSMRTHHSFYRN